MLPLLFGLRLHTSWKGSWRRALCIKQMLHLNRLESRVCHWLLGAVPAYCVPSPSRTSHLCVSADLPVTMAGTSPTWPATRTSCCRRRPSTSSTAAPTPATSWPCRSSWSCPLAPPTSLRPCAWEPRCVGGADGTAAYGRGGLERGGDVAFLLFYYIVKVGTQLTRVQIASRFSHCNTWRI